MEVRRSNGFYGIVFGVMTYFPYILTSWRACWLNDLLSFFLLTFYRIFDVLAYFVTSWRISGCYDVLFYVFIYFMTSWCTYWCQHLCFVEFHTFWHYHVHFDSTMHFLTPWRIFWRYGILYHIYFDVITYIIHLIEYVFLVSRSMSPKIWKSHINRQ